MNKNIFPFLFLSIGSLFSCSLDPVPEKKKSDPIVGNWERIKNVYVFENDSIAIHDFSHCPEPNSLIFMNREYKRAIVLSFYTLVNEAFPDSCQKVAGGGTWTKISDQKYSVHIDYFDDSDPYNIGEETILFRASFSAPDSLFLRNRNKLEEYQVQLENLQDFYTVYALDDGGIDYTPYLPE